MPLDVLRPSPSPPVSPHILAMSSPIRMAPSLISGHGSDSSSSTDSSPRSSPPSQHSPLSSPKSLTFSIENILRKDFGNKNHQSSMTIFRTDIGRKATVNRASPPPRAVSTDPDSDGGSTSSTPPAGASNNSKQLWPAWVYCTRYSDRPSSGPRSKKMKKREKKTEEKRPRTAFTTEQLQRLKREFTENKYLTEKRRRDLAQDLNLNESQIKIWFQNKRAKIKKSSGQKNPLALSLMAQGLYNHTSLNSMDEED